MADYTEQELKGKRSTNNIYQNTTYKIQAPKEKIWTHSLSLRKSKKQKFSITRP